MYSPFVLPDGYDFFLLSLRYKNYGSLLYNMAFHLPRGGGANIYTLGKTSSCRWISVLLFPVGWPAE